MDRPRSAPTRRFGPTRLIVMATIMLVTTTACGNARPTADEWVPLWTEMLSAIPSLERLTAADPKPSCDEALAAVRDGQSSLKPTPDRAIDDAVNRWVSVAESTFFQCPPETEDLAGFEGAFEELTRLEAEINTVLDLDR